MIRQRLSSASQWGNGRSSLCGQRRWWPFSCRLERTSDWWDTFCIWQTRTSPCQSWTPTPPAVGIWNRSEGPSSIPTFPLYQPTLWRDILDSGGSETVERCASFQTCARVGYFHARRIQKSSRWISQSRLRWRWHRPDYRSTRTGLDGSWKKKSLNSLVVFGEFKLKYKNDV